MCHEIYLSDLISMKVSFGRVRSVVTCRGFDTVINLILYIDK